VRFSGREHATASRSLSPIKRNLIGAPVILTGDCALQVARKGCRAFYAQPKKAR